MKAYIFPGQGAQYPGMGKDLYEGSLQARELFEQANDILGFRITEIMFEGSMDDLKQTRVTQPAIFLHSCILSRMMKDFAPSMVAGHSLGEFSALAACGALTFEDGLRLVYKRALSMQKACEMAHSGMAAVLGMDDHMVGELCRATGEILVPANYNCPGQVVISGSLAGIEKACDLFPRHGAKRVIRLAVGGAFHSPFMEPAREELAEAIRNVSFKQPSSPVYQNVNGLPSMDPGAISKNLILQLTMPVMWTQSIRRMIADGAVSFTEVGPGQVLQGLVKKISGEAVTFGIDNLPSEKP